MDEDEVITLRILCIDSGESTCNNSKYWDFVKSLARKHGPFDHIVHWNLVCTRVPLDKIKKIQHRAPCSSQPGVFFEYIFSELNILRYPSESRRIELYVITDGKILVESIILQESVESDILQSADCADLLAPYLNCLKIYYVGDEEQMMSFGLNAIFGALPQLQYAVNQMNQYRPVWTLDKLKDCIAKGDIYDKNFLPSLVCRVKYVELKLRKEYNIADCFVHQVQDIHKELIKLLDNETKTRDTQIVRECYESNDGQRLEREIQEIPEDAVVERTKLYSFILSFFENTTGLQLDRSIVEKQKIEEIVESCATMNDVATESSLSVAEDSITFAQIDSSRAFLMVQTQHEPLLDPNSPYVRNPISILENDTLCDNIFKRFEMHTLSFETVLKLKSVGTSGQEFESAYTRATCRPFALDPCDWPRVHLNSFAVSHLFEKNSDDGKFIYGNMLIWNLTFLCLIKKQVGLSVSSEHKNFAKDIVECTLYKLYYNETFLYPLTMHLKIAVPFKSGLPLYIVQWYINRVAPFYAENDSRNVLRMPGTRALFDLYKEFGKREEFDTEEIIAELENKVNLWNS